MPAQIVFSFGFLPNYSLLVASGKALSHILVTPAEKKGICYNASTVAFFITLNPRNIDNKLKKLFQTGKKVNLLIDYE